MPVFKNFKTSEKITVYFSIFNVISLVVLLLSINVAYFFIWYNDQKEESWYDMNMNYQQIVWGHTNTEAFKKYILQKDTIIIPNNWEDIVCSQWVAKKLHNDVELVDEIKDSLFYKEDGVLYFIFTKTYDEIGEVKVLFDTTSYVESQIIIIKISLILIVISMLLYYFGWKILSHYALRNLKHIASRSQDFNLNTDWKEIDIEGPKEDEIQILAWVLNRSFEKIQKQSEDQKQFITDVSHELKTPLMVINSKIDVYNKKCEKGTCWVEEMVDLRTGIKSNTQKLNKILETLLLLSRFESDEVEYEKQEVNISEFIENITSDLLLHSTKQITPNFAIQKNVSKTIERTTFTILLENLLTNACKFSDEWSVIEIGLNEEKMWVQDTWIWIAEEELSQIFEKFYRTTPWVEGFWVGLSIVKRIVDFYKWRITVTSIQEKGTCFTIYFDN